ERRLAAVDAAYPPVFALETMQESAVSTTDVEDRIDPCRNLRGNRVESGAFLGIPLEVLRPQKLVLVVLALRRQRGRHVGSHGSPQLDVRSARRLRPYRSANEIAAASEPQRISLARSS